MLQLLQHLSANTDISIDELLLVYGEHFFSLLEKIYPGLLATYKDPIEMLAITTKFLIRSSYNGIATL